MRGAALVLGLALAACGDDGGMTTMIDASTQQLDAPAANCLVMANYGDLGTATGSQGTMGGVSATFTLEAGPPRDTFFLKMVTGKGVFAGGINPGTYTITGDDADYNDCGLCVHIIADIVTGSGPSKFYFATSGTVMLSDVDTPIAGTAQNLMFHEVDISSGAPTGTCTSAIGAITFSTQ